MTFMKPVYYEGAYSIIENTSGESWYVPEEIAWKDAGDYCEGSPASLTIQEGVLWHLSAPGYMDQTAWTPADTIEEARKELSDQHEVCADCGEDYSEEWAEGAITCPDCSE